MADNRSGGTVGDHLTVCQHDDPVSDLSHQFDVMGRHDYAVALCCEPAEQAG